MRALLKLVVVLLVANALFRFVPPYWNDTRFREETSEQAVEWGTLAVEEVQEAVLEVARKHHVPIAADDIVVNKSRDRIAIDVQYSLPIALVPGWIYRWTFDKPIRAWTLNRRAP